MDIVTKFALGTDALLELTVELAREKYASVVDERILKSYISENFNQQALIAEINNISNQWLVVYVDHQPAGYACISTKGQRPAMLEDMRVIRMVDFGVLQRYEGTAVRDALFDKCMTVCRSFEGIWINEYTLEAEYLESKGFIRQEGVYQMDELPIASVLMIKKR